MDRDLSLYQIEVLKIVLRKQGFLKNAVLLKADAVKELSKTHESVVECCLFITVTDARKLGIINKDDEIIFNEPSRLN